jgi:hypothetical protein
MCAISPFFQQSGTQKNVNMYICLEDVLDCAKGLEGRIALPFGGFFFFTEANRKKDFHTNRPLKNYFKNQDKN